MNELIVGYALIALVLGGVGVIGLTTVARYEEVHRRHFLYVIGGSSVWPLTAVALLGYLLIEAGRAWRKMPW